MSGKRKVVVIERTKTEGNEDDPNDRTFIIKRENIYGGERVPNEPYEQIILPSSGSDKEPEVRTVQPEVDEQYKQAQGLFYSTAEENTEDGETPKANSPKTTSPTRTGPHFVRPIENIYTLINKEVTHTSGSDASNEQSSGQSSGSSNKEDKPIIITNLPKPEEVEKKK